MPPKPIPPELLSLRQHNIMALFVQWRLKEIAQGRAGGDKAFAEAVGMANAHWSRIKAGTPLGGVLARRVEAACGVSEGWLDQVHADNAGLGEAPAASSPVAPTEPTLQLLPHSQSTGALLQMFGPGAALTMPQAEYSTPAGFPSPAADFEVHSVDLAQQMGLHQPTTFIARVRGLSMVGKGIDDGDLLVINKALAPQHGQTVVAVIDNELTCKTLYQRNGVVKLQAANPDFPEIVPKEGQTLTIWGVVTAVIKKMTV